MYIITCADTVQKSRQRKGVSKVSIKKMLITVLMASAGALLVLWGITAFREYNRYISGDEWFAKQYVYVNDLADYADSVDTVMALYQCGTISKEDYLSHISVLKSELGIMRKDYNDEKEAHPVRTGTYTYTTKKGCEAVESLYDIYDDILRLMGDYADSTEELNYYYTASRQRVIKALADYRASRDIVDGVWDMDDDDSVTGNGE